MKWLYVEMVYVNVNFNNDKDKGHFIIYYEWMYWKTC